MWLGSCWGLLPLFPLPLSKQRVHCSSSQSLSLLSFGNTALALQGWLLCSAQGLAFKSGLTRALSGLLPSFLLLPTSIPQCMSHSKYKYCNNIDAKISVALNKRMNKKIYKVSRLGYCFSDRRFFSLIMKTKPWESQIRLLECLSPISKNWAKSKQLLQYVGCWYCDLGTDLCKRLRFSVPATLVACLIANLSVNILV